MEVLAKVTYITDAFIDEPEGKVIINDPHEFIMSVVNTLMAAKDSPEWEDAPDEDESTTKIIAEVYTQNKAVIDQIPFLIFNGMLSDESFVIEDERNVIYTYDDIGRIAHIEYLQ